MNFVNNYLEPITLAPGATSAALNLPDGEYVLTLADSTTPPARYEIVHAAVAGGVAALSRAQEGTLDQAWGHGSVIFAGVTAGILEALSNAAGGGGESLPWGSYGFAMKFSEADPGTHTISPTDLFIAAASFGAGMDVTLYIPSDMPIGTAIRPKIQVAVGLGSALYIRAPAEILEASIAGGEGEHSLEESATALRTFFPNTGDGRFQTLLELDLVVFREPEGFIIDCTYRDAPDGRVGFPDTVQ